MAQSSRLCPPALAQSSHCAPPALAVFAGLLVVQATRWPDTWRSVVVLSILLMVSAVGTFINARGDSLISRHDSMRAIAERVRMHPWDTQLHLDALREIQLRDADDLKKKLKVAQLFTTILQQFTDIQLLYLANIDAKPEYSQEV